MSASLRMSSRKAHLLWWSPSVSQNFFSGTYYSEGFFFLSTIPPRLVSWGWNLNSKALSQEGWQLKRVLINAAQPFTTWQRKKIVGIFFSSFSQLFLTSLLKMVVSPKMGFGNARVKWCSGGLLVGWRRYGGSSLLITWNIFLKRLISVLSTFILLMVPSLFHRPDLKIERNQRFQVIISLHPIVSLSLKLTTTLHHILLRDYLVALLHRSIEFILLWLCLTRVIIVWTR